MGGGADTVHTDTGDPKPNAQTQQTIAEYACLPSSTVLRMHYGVRSRESKGDNKCAEDTKERHRSSHSPAL